MSPNPQPGAGQRDVLCDHSGDCLDQAVRRGWSAFNCASCPIAGTARQHTREAIAEQAQLGRVPAIAEEWVPGGGGHGGRPTPDSGTTLNPPPLRVSVPPTEARDGSSRAQQHDSPRRPREVRGRGVTWRPTPARVAALAAAAEEKARCARARRERVFAASRRLVPPAEIASLLGVSRRTVERHRARLRAEGRL